MAVYRHLGMYQEIPNSLYIITVQNLAKQFKFQEVQGSVLAV